MKSAMSSTFTEMGPTTYEHFHIYLYITPGTEVSDPLEIKNNNNYSNHSKGDHPLNKNNNGSPKRVLSQNGPMHPIPMGPPPCVYACVRLARMRGPQHVQP